MKPTYQLSFVLALTLLITGCYTEVIKSDGPPDYYVDVNVIPDARPKHEDKSQYGNPKTYQVYGQEYEVMDSHHGFKERGRASWYGRKFHGKRTSSGEPYDMHAMTAAHKTLPIPSYVRVTNLENQRTTVVKVNDRGPFAKGRIIDLSYTAAKKLGVTKHGTAEVEIEAISVTPNTSLAELDAAQASTVATTPAPTKPAPSVETPITNPQPAPAPPSRAETSAPKLPTGAIQVAAFKDMVHAATLRKRLLATTGLPVTIQTSDSNWHRVIAGPITTPQQRDKLINELNAEHVALPRALRS